MLTAVVDSNVLEPLLVVPGAYEAVARARADGRLDLLCTHVTVDEVAAIADPGTRSHRLVTLFGMTRMVPATGFVLDGTGLGVLRFPEALQDRSVGSRHSQHSQHSRDELLVSTARDLGCALVTEEPRLRNLARPIGVPVLTAEGLLREVGWVPG